MIRLVRLHHRLYVRGHTCYLDSSNVLAALQNVGITTVYCLATKEDAPLAAAMRTVGMTYRHEPLVDGLSVDVPRTMEISREVSKAMTHETVLVHCSGGKNRTGLVAAIALAIHTGRPTSELVPEMRARRSTLLTNEVFEKFVLEFVS